MVSLRGRCHILKGTTIRLLASRWGTCATNRKSKALAPSVASVLPCLQMLHCRYLLACGSNVRHGLRWPSSPCCRELSRTVAKLLLGLVLTSLRRCCNTQPEHQFALCVSCCFHGCSWQNGLASLFRSLFGTPHCYPHPPKCLHDCPGSWGSGGSGFRDVARRTR